MLNSPAQSPRITCGISAYNAAGTLERAVTSALKQDYPNVEILIVDDASSDSTPKLIAQLCQQHPQLRQIRHQTNQGGQGAYNTLLAHATGDFIAFFDDDDDSAPSRLTQQLAAIKACEAIAEAPTPAVLCHTARQVIYPNGTARIELPMGITALPDTPRGDKVALHILAGGQITDGRGATASCSLMARRDALITIGGYDPNFRRGWDTELIVRAAQQGAWFTGIAEPLVTQWLQPSAGEKTLSIESAVWLATIDKHATFLKQHGLYQFARYFTQTRFAFYRRHYVRALYYLTLATLHNPLNTVRRLVHALPNIGLNRRMAAFYQASGQ